MDARVAFLDAIADFGVGVPQQRLPAAGVMDQVARDIAVPDAGAAAGDGERHAPLAFAQRVRPYAQPRRGLVAIDGHRRKDGELPQVGALVGVEVARLVVEQTETADPLAIAAKQRATGMEAREGRLVQPGLSGKARVRLQVGDYQDFPVIAGQQLPQRKPAPGLQPLADADRYRSDTEVEPRQTGECVIAFLAGSGGAWQGGFVVRR
ncbi:hypothetical protein D3C80_1281600 [compost metagenome]